MSGRIGGVALTAAGMVMVMGVASAAPAATGTGHAAGPGMEGAGNRAGPSSPGGSASRQPGGVSPGAAASPQDAAARSRMHECGHQWANIKRAGNAGTTTWKEFSATCLVTR